MSELWEVSSLGWTLPVKVWWQSNEIGWVKDDVVPLLQIQRACLNDALLIKGWMADNRVFIHRADLTAIAGPSRETNPEKVVRWFPRFYDVGDGPEGCSNAEREFLARWCQWGWIKDIGEAMCLWHHLQKHMLDWLLIERKPLDLRFAVLTCHPYRANWKQVVHRGMGRVTAEKVSKSRPLQDSLLSWLIRPELLSSKGDTIRHCIDVTPSAWFWKNVVKTEKKREEQLGDSYWTDVLNRMKLGIDEAYDGFIGYLQEIRQPIPFVGQSDSGGAPDLPPDWCRVEGDFASSMEDVPFPDSIDRATGEEAECWLVGAAEAKEALSSVPDI